MPNTQVSVAVAAALATTTEINDGKEQPNYDFRTISKQEYNDSNNVGLTWDKLFGKDATRITFLTKESQAIINNNYSKFFGSGVDLGRLPTGFFVVKNPITGYLDVLHYDEDIDPQQSKLAITLKDNLVEVRRANLTFDSKDYQPNALYYSLKCLIGGGVCSYQQFDLAYKEFVDSLQAHGLYNEYTNIVQANNSYRFVNDENPIVILSRFEQVLFQRNLKQADRAEQLKRLLEIFAGNNVSAKESDVLSDSQVIFPLTSSLDVIRKIEDASLTDKPCTFICRELFCDNLASFDDEQELTNKSEFFRFICYQSERFNMAEYYKCYRLINSEIDSSLDTHEKLVIAKFLLNVLAKSTSGDNFNVLAKRQSLDLQYENFAKKSVSIFVKKLQSINMISYLGKEETDFDVSKSLNSCSLFPLDFGSKLLPYIDSQVLLSSTTLGFNLTKTRVSHKVSPALKQLTERVKMLEKYSVSIRQGNSFFNKGIVDYMSLVETIVLAYDTPYFAGNAQLSDDYLSIINFNTLKTQVSSVVGSISGYQNNAGLIQLIVQLMVKAYKKPSILPVINTDALYGSPENIIHEFARQLKEESKELNVRNINSNDFNVQNYIDDNKNYFVDSGSRLMISMIRVIGVFQFNNDNYEEYYSLLNQINFEDCCKVEFCVEVFAQAIQSIDFNKVNEKIFMHASAKTELELLELIKQDFNNFFNEGYLDGKIAEINAQDISEIDKRHINQLFSLPSDRQRLYNIYGHIIRNSTPSNKRANIEKLNNDFTLSVYRANGVRLDKVDVSALLTSLVDIKEYLTADNIVTLTNSVIKQQSLGALQQVKLAMQAYNLAVKSIQISNIVLFIDNVANVRNYIARDAKEQPNTLNAVQYCKLQKLLATLVVRSDQPVFSLISTVPSKQESPLPTNMQLWLNQLIEVISYNPQVTEHLYVGLHHIITINSQPYSNLQLFIKTINEITVKLKAEYFADNQIGKAILFNILAKLKTSDINSLSTFSNSIVSYSGCYRDIFSLVDSFLDANETISDINVFLHNQNSLVSLLSSKPLLPRLSSLLGWDESNIEQYYHKFQQQPLLRNFDYGFKEEDYIRQQALFLEVGNIFDDNLKDLLKNNLQANRSKTIQELLRLKQQFANPQNKEQKVGLLCVCIEMLARTVSQKSLDNPNDVVGQELNATQIMVLCSMILSGNKKVITEVDTGEGKSRIMMVLSAYLASQGNAVDFITSNMQLAERDFFAYKRFFKALGLKVSLIFADSAKEFYNKSGINFTDTTSLTLCRNRDDIEGDGRGFWGITNTVALIDEVDYLLCSKHTEACNYANNDEDLRGMSWVYGYLFDLVTSPSVAQTVDSVRAYVENEEQGNQERLAKFRKVTNEKLKTWIHSASKANNMQLNVDYALSNKQVEVLDDNGVLKVTKVILVLDQGRVMPGSSYADGVQQFLSYKHQLFVPSELVTTRSIYPVAAIAKYKSIYGVSGTTRRDAPLFNPAVLNIDGFNYVKAPRHTTLNRKSNRTWITKDGDSKILAIRDSIKRELANNSKAAFLVICTDDDYSQVIFNAINDLGTTRTRVHSLTTSTEEQQAIENGGCAGTITVSTAGMFSRGADMRAEDLFVINTTILPHADEVQVKGRTGRFGKDGTYILILSQADFNNDISWTYNHTSEARRIQQSLDLKNVLAGEINKVYGKFLEDIHRLYLKHTQEIDQKKWVKFLKFINDNWVIYQDDIIAEVNNPEQLKDRFNTFKNLILGENFIICFGYANHYEITSPFSGYLNHCQQAINAYKQFYNKPIQKQVITTAEYHPADDGQASVYSNLFVTWRANLTGKRKWFANTRAWREGRGILFANSKALLKGDRAIFANTRAAYSAATKEEQGLVKRFVAMTTLVVAGIGFSYFKLDYLNKLLSMVFSMPVKLNLTQGLISSAGIVILVAMLLFAVESVVKFAYNKFFANTKNNGSIYRKYFLATFATGLLLGGAGIVLSIVDLSSLNQLVNLIIKQAISLNIVSGMLISLGVVISATLVLIIVSALVKQAVVLQGARSKYLQAMNIGNVKAVNTLENDNTLVSNVNAGIVREY